MVQHSWCRKLRNLFSYPFKQRTHQEFNVWADTIKVSESIKGLLSEALWDELVTPGTGNNLPQLLLIVKKVMEWTQPGEDLNKIPREFLL